MAKTIVSLSCALQDQAVVWATTEASRVDLVTTGVFKYEIKHFETDVGTKTICFDTV